MKYVSNTIYVLKLVWKICPGRVVAEFLIRAIEYISWIFYSIIFSNICSMLWRRDRIFRS